MQQDLKPLPCNIDAEKALLCSIQLDPALVDELPKGFGLEQFWAPASKFVFSAFVAVRERDRTIEFFAVRDYLAAKGQLEEVGGREGLNEVFNCVPASSNWRYYVRAVWESWIRRKVILAANALIDRLYDPALEEVAGEVRDFAEREILAISQDTKQQIRTFKEWLLDTVDEIEARSRTKEFRAVRFGLESLDKALGGLEAGDLVIIAAETSFGKSSLALQAARISAAAGVGSAIFSFEMPPKQLVERILSAEATIPVRSMRAGLLTETELPRFTSSIQRIVNYPIWLSETSALDISGIVSVCRHLKAKHDIGLVVVDYLQLVPALTHRKESSREREVAEISRKLKILAGELSLPVIACSQLNDEGKLRESRAIGQDADVILKILEPRDASDVFRRNILIGKQRHGPKDQRISVNFFGQYMTFESSQY